MARRKVRAYLTIVGIVIGIAAIVSLISLSQGLENAVTSQFEKMGISDIRVLAKGLRGAPIGNEVLTTSDMDVVENVVGVDYVIGILIGMTNVEFNNEKKFMQVLAYPTDKAEKGFADVDIEFIEGRNFKKTESGGVVIGYNIAKDLFDKDIRVRNRITIDEEKFKVIGIMKEAGNPQLDNTIYIPIDEGRDIFEKPDELSVMIVHVKEGKDINEVSESIYTKLKRKRDNENFEVFTPQQILDQLSTILGIVNIVLVGIAAISLLVGGIGIMNAMYTSVLERTKEIGIMKAIGATNQSILGMFLLESGLLGLGGGILGAALGTAFAFLFGEIVKQLGFPLILIQVEWSLIFFVLAFSFGVGVISGTLPAFRASRLQPADALRYE